MRSDICDDLTLTHAPWSECCTAEHAHWEGSSVGLPTNLFPRNEASCTPCKSELNVCLPTLPHPVCEWSPSFKCSLLSRHKRFYTDLTEFQDHKERWERGSHSPEENKPVHIDLLPIVYPCSRWAPYRHSWLWTPLSGWRLSIFLYERLLPHFHFPGSQGPNTFPYLLMRKQ